MFVSLCYIHFKPNNNSIKKFIMTTNKRKQKYLKMSKIPVGKGRVKIRVYLCCKILRSC